MNNSQTPVLTWTDTLFADLLMPHLIKPRRLNYAVVVCLLQISKPIANATARTLTQLDEKSLTRPLTREQTSEVQHQQKVFLTLCVRRLYYTWFKSLTIADPQHPQALDAHTQTTYENAVSALSAILFGEIFKPGNPSRLLEANQAIALITGGLGLQGILQHHFQLHLHIIKADAVNILTNYRIAEITTLKLLTDLAKQDRRLIHSTENHGNPVQQAWLHACLLSRANRIKQVFFVNQVMRQYRRSLTEVYQHHNLPVPLQSHRAQLMTENFLLALQNSLLARRHANNSGDECRENVALISVNLMLTITVIAFGYLVDRYKQSILTIGFASIILVNLLIIATGHTPKIHRITNRYRLRHNQQQLEHLALTNHASANLADPALVV